MEPSEKGKAGNIEGMWETHSEVASLGEAQASVGNWWELRLSGRWGTDCEEP